MILWLLWSAALISGMHCLKETREGRYAANQASSISGFELAAWQVSKSVKPRARPDEVMIRRQQATSQ
jgi:hypothetical protein